MRTTVTLNEGLVRELLEFSKAKTKTAAVIQAVKEQIRRAKLRQLADMLGSVEIDGKAIREGKEADIERAQWLQDMGKQDEAE